VRPLGSAGRVVVNLAPGLRVLICEAQYLDRKGFSIPPLALQVALQQGEYRSWSESLERLLALYYEVGGGGGRGVRGGGGRLGVCGLCARRRHVQLQLELA
jgi:hypothetical protein